MPFLSTFSAVEANVSLTTTMDNFFVQPLIDVKAISFHSDNNVFCSKVLKNKVKWNFTSKKKKTTNIMYYTYIRHYFKPLLTTVTQRIFW